MKNAELLEKWIEAGKTNFGSSHSYSYSGDVLRHVRCGVMARKLNGSTFLVSLLPNYSKAAAFNPELVALQLGLTVEKVKKLRARSKYQDEDLYEADCRNTEAMTHFAYCEAGHVIGTIKRDVYPFKIFRVLNPLADPSSVDVENYCKVIEARLDTAMTKKSSWHIAYETGYSNPFEIPTDYSYKETSAEAMMAECHEFCKEFRIPKFNIRNMDKKFEKALHRHKMIHLGGITFIKKLYKEMCLPDSVPLDEIKELLETPQFSKNYQLVYTHDIMIRHIACAHLREKYGTRNQQNAKPEVV